MASARRLVGVGAVLGLMFMAGPADSAFAQDRDIIIQGPRSRSADQTREELRQLLSQYPPSVGQVLRLDPTLMASDGYLTSYPALQAFLKQHPEVAKSPDHYLAFVRTADSSRAPSAGEAMRRQIQDNLEALGVGMTFAGVAFALGWLIRHFLAHRRWLRATKIQVDLHHRLMERLTSSEDVRNYLESAATSRLLADVPPMLEAGRHGAPIGRILLAVQAGVVLICAATGVLWVKSLINATNEPAEVMVFFGVVGICLGVGFVLSAAVSYILSQRLGLFANNAAPQPGPHDRA